MQVPPEPGGSDGSLGAVFRGGYRSCLVWILGADLRSFGRATGALICWAFVPDKGSSFACQVLVIHGYAFSWKSVRFRNVLMVGTEPYSSLCSMVSLFQIFSMLRGPRRVSQCYYCITVVYTVSTKAILIIQDSSFCYPRPRQNIVSGNMAVLGEHLGRNNGDIGLACSGQEMKWFIPSNGPFCILEAEM